MAKKNNGVVMNQQTIKILCAVILSSSSILSGCGARVKSFPYEANNDAGVGITKSKDLRNRTALGFTYGLPKTIFEIKGTCSLYRQIFYELQPDGSQQESAVLFIANLDEGLDVKPIGIPDPNLRFRIDPKVLRNWRVHTEKANFTVSDDGMLTQLNSSFDDRTAEIIESTSKTAINVAKTIAIAGANSTLVAGLLEKVSTFEITSKVDPEVATPYKPFENLGAKAITEAAANLIKDEMRDTFIPDRITVVVNDIALDVVKIGSPLKSDSGNLRNALAKSNLGSKIIRLASFENLAQNYLDGIVTRIPEYVQVKLTCHPLVVREPKELANSLLNFRNQIANLNQEISTATTAQAQTTDPDARTSIQVQIDKHTAVRDAIVKFEADFNSDKVLFQGPVPVAQFGRLAVVPVHSNTFVKQTKDITINRENGRITQYDFSATSSGERAAKMLENISKSVVDELPNLLKAGGAAKSDAK